MSLSINYVADHIDRIDRRHGGKQDLILDSKWRIASSLEMFGSELKKNGILTLSQLHQVDVYIAKFKSTPGGQEALAQYQRRAS